MNALRIFAHGGRRPLAGPARTLEPARAMTSRCVPLLVLSGPAPAPAETSPDARTDEDALLLRLLARAREPHETVSAAYQRKEQELRAMFAALPPAAATALHRRLVTPCPDDPLAAAFHRLVEARRARLLAVLADAPRRTFVQSKGIAR